MEWEIAQSRGVDFAVCRAGSINNITGTLYEDFELVNNVSNCMLPRTFYWYFRPNHSPLKQAQYFHSMLKDIRWEFPLVADVEDSGGLSVTGMRASVKAFLDEIERLTGQKPIIYTRSSFWNPTMGSVSWASEYHIWLARYVSISNTTHRPFMSGPWADGNYKPLGWSDWDMWQFSADGNGLGAYYGALSNSLDLDLMQDDVFDLYTAEPTPPVIDITFELAQIRGAADSIEEKVGV
jgi:lysozyme